jgi:wobble nucleotide-excising tRNase
MLRSFTTTDNFRALKSKPFEHKGDTCVLGRRTVIYGRNGSGKTTLSEILRLALSGGDTDGVTVSASIRQANSTSSARLGSREFPWSILVYNRFYVQESLNLFLEGSAGSPTILKLGATNVAATLELESVRASLTVLGQRREALVGLRRALVAERDGREKEVKSDVISALAASDPSYYNSTRFQVTRAKALLRDAAAIQLSPTDLERETVVAKSAIVQPISPPAPWPSTSVGLKDVINDELLGVEVESQAVPRLTESAAVANWVEKGLGLHNEGDVCEFCQQGVISGELLNLYARHFSEALEALRVRLQEAKIYLNGVRDAIDAWLLALPSTDSLLIDFREAIQLESRSLAGVGARIQAQIDEAVSLIERRLADPLKPLAAEDQLASDFIVADTSAFEHLVAENNSACLVQVERKKAAQGAVEQHYGAASRSFYAARENRIVLAERANHTLDKREASLRTRAQVLEESQQDTGRMAMEIDADLREHFGHGHLKITVSEDGKGYLVKRGKKTAKRLSEGERNAIAFAYFLRSLEGEGVDPDKSIVVIDDPVTSMDKESMFAGFALAEERTKSFAQVIILTHDYEYFRLQLGARANARQKSEARIKANDSSERAYPAVSVLEILATVDPVSGNRTSSLRQMPPSLVRHPSEYHYLFLKVAEAVRDGDHAALPLLGNAARRLLEGFTSFRAPSGDNFQQKVDSIKKASSIDEVLARRVVKFLHGQSHREEPRPSAALDFPSIETELKSALQFIQKADADHFTEMCKAVEIDEAALIVAP